jgi:hypothetical protein
MLVRFQLRCVDVLPFLASTSAAALQNTKLQLHHFPAQVPCRGRGVSPEPLAVNMAVWEIRKALEANPNFYILVHCTHGFNRSGAQQRLGIAMQTPLVQSSASTAGSCKGLHLCDAPAVLSLAIAAPATPAGLVGCRVFLDPRDISGCFVVYVPLGASCLL